MIRDIVTDKELLAMPSVPVTEEVRTMEIVEELVDTAEHWRTTKIGCLGLAANQIGWLFRIIVIWEGNHWLIMVNPSWRPRDAKMGSSNEQCLSRPSANVKIKRHKRIECSWEDPFDGDQRSAKYSHLTARIIQHEVDHLDGIYIGR